MSDQNGQCVVVTGIGAVTPLGLTVNDYWDGLVNGRSGIRSISLFDPSRLAVRIAGEAPDFDPHQHLGRKDARRMDRFSQFAVVAALEAAANAELAITDQNSARTGCVIGTGIGGIVTLNQQFEVLFTRGPSRLSPFVVPMMLPNMASGQVSIFLHARGPNFAPTSACSSAGDAIGLAAESLRRDEADIMIAGGSEAPVCEMSVAGFHAARALSTSNELPEKASRPFDLNRDGFVMGEGAGVLILERVEHALRRDAPILAEFAGYANVGDAFHITQPTENGDGGVRAMTAALAHAQVRPSEVDYINAHGTSTPINDRVETMAIKQVFGEAAPGVAISSTKSMTGHLMGAAGAIEAVVCIKAINDGVVPPTINLDTPDPDCDLDYVPHKARQLDVRVAISNSFGFGGHNSCLVLKRWEP
ncbi:MAG: beta-ketoacyl-ACP synthase II [Dehalococcoidia bacterium]